MIELSRRSLLTGTAAVTAAVHAPSLPVHAAAPPIGKQAPGFYRYKVGDAEVTVITDGATRFRFPDGFVVNKNRDEVNAAWMALFQEKDQMVIPYSPIVVNTGSKLVVIDTGTGEANFERSKGAAGQFHSNLMASGINPDQVDTVIISHFHGDHISGLLGKDDKPKFTKAEILVPAVEWKYFMDDAEMNKQTSDRMKGAFAAARKVFDALGRKVTQYEPNKEVAPGITSVASYGHTPGHMSFVIASGNNKVFVQSDVTNNPLFVRNPDFHPVFDQDAAMAEETRRKVYDMLVAEKMLVQGFHYPFPALANIEKSGSGYREIPVQWNPVI
jgi:glyoxylase-like metal-dependent hydrolase (beta-lactamase superfamily II)